MRLMISIFALRQIAYACIIDARGLTFKSVVLQQNLFGPHLLAQAHG
jgi:hypothetical protein